MFISKFLQGGLFSIYNQMQKENPAFEFWFFFFTPAFLLPGLKAETNRSKSQLPANVKYNKYYKHANKSCTFVVFDHLASQGSSKDFDARN